MNYKLPDTDEALLAECEQEMYSSSGPGGQNVNRRSTAVRLRHLPTGLVVSCQEERSQHRNRTRCVEKLRRAIEQRRRRRRRRIPTSVPSSVNKTRLKSKAHRAKLKENRRRPQED